MKTNRKILTLFLLTVLPLAHCKRTSLFTEIDANFKSLDDVFVDEFHDQKKSVEKNRELALDAEEALTGRFGTLLSLDVWEFKNDADCKQAYSTLVGIEKQNGPREYDQVQSSESRYTFTRQMGVAGEIFTLKKILFRILATDKATIRDYLITSKLARSR